MVRARPALPALLLTLAVATPPGGALAQGAQRPPDLSGTYVVRGTGSDSASTPYEARLEMKRNDHVTVPIFDPAWEVEIYHVKYKFPNGGADLNGVGALIGNTFYLAYADDKKFFLEFLWPWTMSEEQQAAEARIQSMEAKSYDTYVKNRPWYSDLDPASAWAALWFHYDESFGVGGFTRRAWVGQHRYRLHEVNDKFQWEKEGQKSEWWESGTLTVEETGKNFVVRFRESEDYSYSGVAMPAKGGMYVAAVGGDRQAGIAVFRFSAEGLVGTWAAQGDTRRGTETLAPSDDVRKKASALFVD